MPENDIFYFHPDHLGSTSYITSRNGSISQHVEYIAFGEVLFEEHSSSFKSPYLFNGKELDRETNLSYYGARYLDMKTSLWLSLDKEGENDLSVGGYVYSFNNPINFIDPDGNWPDLPSWKEVKKSYNTAKNYVSNQTTKAINYLKNHAVAKVESKVTFGAQLGIKTPFGSLGGGAATVDLVKVKATTKKGGSYFKGPNEMDGKGHYFLEGKFNIPGTKTTAGGKADWVNDTALPNGNGNGSNGNTDLLQSSSYQGKFEYEGSFGPKGASPKGVEVGDISLPSVKYSGTLSNKEDCLSCFEIKFGAKAIIGFDIKIQLGTD